jgi:hypothetical protein
MNNSADVVKYIQSQLAEIEKDGLTHHKILVCNDTEMYVFLYRDYGEKSAIYTIVCFYVKGLSTAPGGFEKKVQKALIQGCKQLTNFQENLNE